MMTTIIEETWALPEVDTVFEFVFAMELGAAPEGHRVAVTCLWPPVETRFVTLNAARATPICLHFDSGYELRGMMEVTHDGDRRTPSIGVYADLSYDWRGQPPVQHFQGLIFLREEPIPPPDPPPPLVPPPPFVPPPAEPPDGETLPVITAHDELFPYVYVRQWPTISDEDLEYGFFSYVYASPPGGSFIVELGDTVPQGRAAMEGLALAFIDGDPPWQGQYIASRSSLSGPVSGFAQLALRLRQPEAWREEWVDQLRRDMTILLDRYGQTGAWLLGAEYAATLDRIWQSYFALVVLLGYDQALLADLGLTLWLANAAAKALVVDEAGDLRVGDLTAEQRGAVAHASLLLPATVFPPPPGVQEPGSPPWPGDRGWVEPYAVGDLQMVRQRLVRYAAGEIARIENVMRGERREVSSRQGRRRLDLQQKSGDEEQILESEDADGRICLLEETSRIVAGKTILDTYGDFTSSYGPPTQATLSGTLTRATTAGTPGSDEVTRFAREILGKTVNRISRKVGTVRASSTLSQVEDAVVSVIDNVAGDRNLCAVYRWVNKIYEARVVNYGNRLIMEFMIRLPSSGFAGRFGPERYRLVPVPLADAGIESFADVTPLNYARLCADYGVTDISPPPEPKLVSNVLRSGEETQIPVPPGYCARIARVGCVSMPPGAPAPAIMVGCQLVAPGEEGATLAPRGEESTLPVSVAAMAASLSPPDCPEALVNVEIECAPTPRCTDEWRILIYAAVVKAYEQSVERRLTGLADGALPVSPRSPLACREIERRALRHECTRLLLERAALMTGGGASTAQSPPPGEVDEPRTLQFLDEAMEWPEMTYMFQAGHPGCDHPEEDGGDALFSSFLHADRARVLVPARPERVIAFLYFFGSGTIWDGPDRLVAVSSGDVHIVDDLKRIARRREPERGIGRPWEIVVPTAMQVLDGLDLAPHGAGPGLLAAGEPA